MSSRKVERPGGGAGLLNIGFGNVVAAERVVAVVTPGSAPVKRMKDSAKASGRLVDATQGRRTRAVIVTDSDHVILSAVGVETITQRLEGRDEAAES
ncbi:MAG: DUF370 domain-containing protein [Candidatus Eisenbacteria bacterium]|nr:DUF370 domain-containing protein [Candidatus Eisenbacteria bacterium]